MYQDYNSFYQELGYLLDDTTHLNSIKSIPTQQYPSNELLLSTSFYPLPNIDTGLLPMTAYHDYSIASPTPSTHGSSCTSSPNIDNIYDYFSFDISLPLLPIDATALEPNDMSPPPTLPKKKQPRPCKTFKCPICNRLFARKHDLQRHIRVHTGDKPYSCINCNKSFARTDALKRHLRMEDTCRTSPVIQALKNTGSRRYRNL